MNNTLYGIKNCDTVKKTRRWLEVNHIEYTFHDYRVDGLDKALLNNFLKQFDLDLLINKRGTTWRKLPDKTKENIDQQKARELMLEFPALIKRPILATNGKYCIGFNVKEYEMILK